MDDTEAPEQHAKSADIYLVPKSSVPEEKHERGGRGEIRLFSIQAVPWWKCRSTGRLYGCAIQTDRSDHVFFIRCEIVHSFRLGPQEEQPIIEIEEGDLHGR